jgi:predicted fused transcriptional regulator/phosphomethylpyrimidine kinase
MAYEAFVVGGSKTIFLKKAIARNLYNKGIDQSEISELLKLSQPMVSNYCSSKEKIPEEIIDIAENISQKIINGKAPVFQTCITFSDKSFEGNYFLANKNEIITDENTKIVNNLTEAFLILKGKNISGLIPEVKINIAMSKVKPAGTDDIAAFLNGFVVADDKIIGYNGIRFGRSKHLSSLLLGLKEDLDTNAIMNIAYIRDLVSKNFSVSYLTKEYKLIDDNDQVDILFHKGDFGIEPCAYILGKDAVDVSKKVLRLISGLNNEK